MEEKEANTLPSRDYPAKLLLFGEYSVLLDQTALAVPFGKYSARWTNQVTGIGSSQKEILTKFLNYLYENFQKAGDAFLDIEEMEKSFRAGLRLNSNIPIGSGLGSSGAFCAAVYDAFGLEKNADLQTLQNHFVSMESFFHGKSSGLDPLVSYLNRPVIGSSGKVAELKPVGEAAPKFDVRLLDTQIKRSTSPLVSLFKQKLESAEYSAKLKAGYQPLILSAINFYSKMDWENLWDSSKKISELQFELFDPMIPDTLKPIWEKGLRSKRYFMKLCGAGGGGFFYLFHKEELDVAAVIPHSFSISKYFFSLSADQ